MGKIKFLIILSLLSIFLLSVGCEKQDNRLKSNNSDTTFNSVWSYANTTEIKIEIADNVLAKNYYVVVDGSGSMSDLERRTGGKSKSEVSKEALIEFIKYVPDDANLGLLAFDSAFNRPKERVPLRSKNAIEFTARVREIGTGGGTPLGDAVFMAYEKLEKQAEKQLGYGEYYLIVITDGMANEGKRDLDEVIKHIISKSPVIIYTIGFHIDENHALNQPGRTVYKTANNFEELKQGLQDVLAESEKFNKISD